MNNIINKFLLAVDTFMPEMNLKQHGFIYTKQEYKNSKKQETLGISAEINHDMVYGDFKDLPRKRLSGKVYEVAPWCSGNNTDCCSSNPGSFLPRCVVKSQW